MMESLVRVCVDKMKTKSKVDFKKILKIDWESVIKDENTSEDHMIKSLIMYKSLGIENLLNLVIIDNFIIKKHRAFFLRDSLGDEGFSVRLKIKIVNRSGLLDSYKIKNKLNRIFEIRNIIAHDTIQEKRKVLTRKEEFKLRELYEEFRFKFESVWKVLYKLSRDK